MKTPEQEKALDYLHGHYERVSVREGHDVLRVSAMRSGRGGRFAWDRLLIARDGSIAQGDQRVIPDQPGERR